MMLHKGASTQCHNPSDRDQQAREKLQKKVKIRSQAYIQLGEETADLVAKATPAIPQAPAAATVELQNLQSPTKRIIGR